MLRSLTKGWYLSCHKYQQIMMYIQIFILLKAAFLLKRIQQSTIRINYKPNKKTKHSSLEQMFKQGKYFDETYSKKFTCEANICSDIIFLPLFTYLRISMNTLSANLITECPLTLHVRSSEYFCLILNIINKYEAAQTSPVLTRAKELS